MKLFVQRVPFRVRDAGARSGSDVHVVVLAAGWVAEGWSYGHRRLRRPVPSTAAACASAVCRPWHPPELCGASCRPSPCGVVCASWQRTQQRIDPESVLLWLRAKVDCPVEPLPLHQVGAPRSPDRAVFSRNSGSSPGQREAIQPRAVPGSTSVSARSSRVEKLMETVLRPSRSLVGEHCSATPQVMVRRVHPEAIAGYGYVYVAQGRVSIRRSAVGR